MVFCRRGKSGSAATALTEDAGDHRPLNPQAQVGPPAGDAPVPGKLTHVLAGVHTRNEHPIMTWDVFVSDHCVLRAL